MFGICLVGFGQSCKFLQSHIIIKSCVYNIIGNTRHLFKAVYNIFSKGDPVGQIEAVKFGQNWPSKSSLAGFNLITCLPRTLIQFKECFVTLFSEYTIHILINNKYIPPICKIMKSLSTRNNLLLSAYQTQQIVFLKRTKVEMQRLQSYPKHASTHVFTFFRPRNRPSTLPFFSFPL